MRLIRLFSIFCLLNINVISHAQDEPSPIEHALFTMTIGSSYPNFIFPVAEWRQDSLSFQVPYYYESVSSLLQYFIPSGEIRITDGRGICKFDFSDEQITIFEGLDCAISVSPDGRYVIYPLQEQICGESCSNLLAVGNLEAGTYATIRKAPDSGNFVRWSEDSSAFLIMDYGQVGGIGGIWYIKMPENGTLESALEPILLENFSVGDIGFVDISPDGQQVLIRGNGTTHEGLTLWDVRSESSDQQFAAWADGQIILRDQATAGASFLPDDEQHLLIILEQGVVLYDLETEQIQIINPDVNTRWAEWAYFSPDLRYVLVYDSWPGGLEGEQLTLFEVNPASQDH